MSDHYVGSHYDWLEENFQVFLNRLGAEASNGLIIAHGDKCYQYRDDWAAKGIPFPHGVAMYLLLSMNPYCKEVRQTINGWVDPRHWVINNYDRFKEHLPDAVWSSKYGWLTPTETVKAEQD